MDTRSRATALAAAICIAACSALAGCADPSSWELRGEVRFVGLRERLDAQDQKTGTLEYSISNTGKSKISGSVFSFTFATDGASYHRTVADDCPVSRGARVYGHVAIAYYSPSEAGSVAGAVVDSVQFE